MTIAYDADTGIPPKAVQAWFFDLQEHDHGDRWVCGRVGEERQARRIALRIAEARRSKPLGTAAGLGQLIERGKGSPPVKWGPSQ